MNAEDGEVVAEEGRKMTPGLARRLVEAGLKQFRVGDEDLSGQYLAEDVINEETGEVYLEAGDELTEEALADLKEAGVAELKTLCIDQANGPYINDTLKVDRNRSREEALMDIYRVMRPGEPPTLDSAEAMFNTLFFDAERYDLSAVGRVKMNARLDLEAEDSVRTLRKEDILAVVKTLVELKDGIGEVDDIDHLGNRRVRSVGELMENQYRIGLLRVERAIRERMGALELDSVMPHDLINAKPGGGGGARVLRLLAAVAVHGPDQPAVGNHPQAQAVRAGPGRAYPRARGVRGARRAPHPLRPDLPDRDAGRPQISA